MTDKELFDIAERVKQQATPEELEEFKRLNARDRLNWATRQIQKMEVLPYGN
ncbi:hypothetical protein ACQRCV_03525 [Streptococcus alactolyticus]|uniref:hypothetical protein n=1 Tax=Streptococcus alactolyticus TaxID=29389 RepID=UPI003CFEDA04